MSHTKINYEKFFDGIDKGIKKYSCAPVPEQSEPQIEKLSLGLLTMEEAHDAAPDVTKVIMSHLDEILEGTATIEVAAAQTQPANQFVKSSLGAMSLGKSVFPTAPKAA